MKKLIWFTYMIMAVAGCKTIKTTFETLTPYEKYIRNLEKASLDQVPMTQEWIQAGEQALFDSVQTDLPFSETGFFAAGKPRATGYRFELKEGQRFTAKGIFETTAGGRVFIDLFRVDNGEVKHVTSADSTGMLQYEFRKDVSCVLRLQPELLIDVFYSLQLTATPVLINPVVGADNRSIRSFYGAPRDGGRRSHEGLDIFAPRGTPVVAPTEGFVSRTGTNRLGGKVVWMRDVQRDHSYYFAHLDSQLVSPGGRVNVGDTLGLVGNTGNARTTPPHLHFGIYQRGSKDPLHFVQVIRELGEPVSPDTLLKNSAFRIKVPVANLRDGPGTDYSIRRTLDAFTFVTAIGQSGEWLRVRLTDDTEGFLYGDLISPADEGEAFERRGYSTLLTAPEQNAIPFAVYEDLKGITLARSGDFEYVKISDGAKGWLFSVR
jgi:peptidoglycan LD-endopeptidase LytH